MLKTIIKKTIPQPLFRRALNVMAPILLRQNAARVKRIFEQAPKDPEWLESEMLEVLQKQYPNIVMQSYMLEDIDKRATAKVEEMVALLNRDWDRMERFLELGCQDGMVSYLLHQSGKL